MSEVITNNETGHFKHFLTLGDHMLSFFPDGKAILSTQSITLAKIVAQLVCARSRSVFCYFWIRWVVHLEKQLKSVGVCISLRKLSIVHGVVRWSDQLGCAKAQQGRRQGSGKGDIATPMGRTTTFLLLSFVLKHFLAPYKASIQTCFLSILAFIYAELTNSIMLPIRT